MSPKIEQFKDMARQARQDLFDQSHPIGRLSLVQCAMLGGDTLVTICALPADGGGLLAVHARARKRGSWVVDEAHWDGLPDGHTRAVTAGGDGTGPRQGRNRDEVPGGLGMLLAAHPQAAAPVARRPLSDYEPGTPA